MSTALGTFEAGSLVSIVQAWLQRRDKSGPPVEMLEAERLIDGPLGLVDVIAAAGDDVAHLVVGLRPTEAPVRPLHPGDDGVLGNLGSLVAADALLDADLAALLVQTIGGLETDVVSIAREDDHAVVLDVGDKCSFSVFPWLSGHPNPGVEMLVGLDEVGFNHLAAPIIIWRRRGRDLGVLQERLAESADGWALALSSLRDLFGSRGDPQSAGGDFLLEAAALGTMASRMHLATEKAFGRRLKSVAQELVELGATDLGPRDQKPSSDVTALRTHGDLHLGRTARTNQGWVISDWLPGGVDERGAPDFRTPLADVADLVWSLRHVAQAALEERDPAMRQGLEQAAQAWVTRNRDALVASYLGAAGIEELVGDRELAEGLIETLARARENAS
ncbi:MAG: hypothetical protein ACRDVP_02380 [Acidimicrobiales bacterium]